MRTKLAVIAGLAILLLALFGSPASAQYPPATTTTVATTDTTAATTTTVAVSPAAEAPVEGGTLARTGSDTNRFVLVGGVLVLVGAFALVTAKRRRHPVA